MAEGAGDDWVDVPLRPVDWNLVASPEERAERLNDVIDHIDHLVEGWNDFLSSHGRAIGK